MSPVVLRSNRKKIDTVTHVADLIANPMPPRHGVQRTSIPTERMKDLSILPTAIEKLTLLRGLYEI